MNHTTRRRTTWSADPDGLLATLDPSVVEILDAVPEIIFEVVLEVALHHGGHQIRQQESAVKGDLNNCITDLEYGEIRRRQSTRRAVTRVCAPPGCMIYETTRIWFSTQVLFFVLSSSRVAMVRRSKL
jgi:hypothetical protein